MKKIIILTLLFFTTVFYGQRKYFADRYFNDFAYKKAVELYESIYSKGDSSIYIVSRIGDSYYNNSEYLEAEKWYGKLLNTSSEEEIDPEYYFKYSQSLKSNGNVEESDKWMLKFRNVNGQDSRPKELEVNKDYFSEYTSKNTVFLNINNISTNTEYSDFGGFIYEDELYFASTKPYGVEKQRIYKWNNQPFLNVYKAKEHIVDDLEEKVLDVESSNIYNVVNSQYHESNIVFTEDGNTMYFTRDNYDGKRLRRDRNKTTNLKIYKSTKVNGKWSNVFELPFNSDEYSVGHPALSPDEKTLFFVSDMPGGIGQTDIYKVSISGDHKTFGDPINLGEEVNTEGKEMFPYVDENNTLYFSSNGLLGLGALDVFESKLSEGNYSSPVNLGTPINSSMDDFAFVINEDLNSGYFSSNREGGKGDDDIYSFMMHNKPEILEPEIEEPEIKKPEVCYEVISGIVRSKHNNELLPNATVRLVDLQGELLGEVLSDKNGEYVFDEIPCALKEFVLKGSKQDFKPDTNKAVTTGEKDHNAKADLTLIPLIIGNQIVISPIYFDFDKSNIRKDAEYELENIVTVMRNHPEMVIKIESHTDSRGSRSYNRSLSDRRAKSTKEYLHTQGIERYRIESATGYGEDNLLNHCNDANRYKCSEEEHQLNRRSYFYIVKGADNVNVTKQVGE